MKKSQKIIKKHVKSKLINYVIKTTHRVGFEGLIYSVGVRGSELRGSRDRFGIKRSHFGLGGVILGLG